MGGSLTHERGGRWGVDEEGKGKKRELTEVETEGREKTDRWSAVSPLAGCHISWFPERKGSFVLSRTFPLSFMPTLRLMYSSCPACVSLRETGSRSPLACRGIICAKMTIIPYLEISLPSSLRLRTREENQPTMVEGKSKERGNLSTRLSGTPADPFSRSPVSPSANPRSPSQTPAVPEPSQTPATLDLISIH